MQRKQRLRKWENYVRRSILKSVDGNLDLSQYGGIKGSCTDHYLSVLYHRILAAAEKKCGTVLLSFDWSKAFSRIDRFQSLRAAKRLGVDDHVLRLLSSYLHSRQLTVDFNGTWSDVYTTTGGTGQGTLLSVLIFVMSIDTLLFFYHHLCNFLMPCNKTHKIIVVFIKWNKDQCQWMYPSHICCWGCSQSRIVESYFCIILRKVTNLVDRRQACQAPVCLTF